MSSVERRRVRSESSSTALHLLLEACRARGGYDAVVVADANGYLVGASTSARGDARELASDLRLPPSAARHALVQVPFRVMDQLLYVGALGAGRAAELALAVFGARRILAS